MSFLVRFTCLPCGETFLCNSTEESDAWSATHVCPVDNEDRYNGDAA